ncbi:hypothetical protein SB30_20035 [Klebsiella quasipneumoniae subsp. similipneumoniae]|nr:hypothetical protein SB30_20035 [Klebsiella quasipneumoniae subsp. similipneumoniae]
MVAQLVWDQWVGGSNPLSPTNFEPRFGGVFCFLLLPAMTYSPDLADKKSSLCLRIRVRKTLNSSLW